MFKSNLVPKIALLTPLFGFAYIAVLILLGQERAMDWGLSGDEFHTFELVLPIMAAVALPATWVLAIYRAYRQGSTLWLLACLLFWPLAFVYTLFVNTGDEP